MKKTIPYCVLYFLFIGLQVKGQAPAKFYGLKSHYGFIIAHSPELKSISQTNPFGFQAEMSKLKVSDKAWKTCFCYGRTGYSFAYYNYNNPEVLGSSYNLNYFVEPYFTYKGPLKFSIRGSIGATYLTKVFDTTSNPTNVLFSTKLSFFLGLSLNLNYHINEKYALNLSGNYNHISNGGQKQPNKGMNFPTFSLGIDRILDYQRLLPKPDSIKRYNRSLKFYAGSFASLRSASSTEESTNHPLIGGFANVLKPLSVINGVNAGVEFWYDWSDQKKAELSAISDSPFSSAITIGHHFSIGDFYFLQQFGVYTTRPKNIQPKWLYQRYSLWYRIKGNWVIGASLIGYGRVADHMDGRLIYRFN